MLRLLLVSTLAALCRGVGVTVDAATSQCDAPQSDLCTQTTVQEASAAVPVKTLLLVQKQVRRDLHDAASTERRAAGLSEWATHATSASLLEELRTWVRREPAAAARYLPVGLGFALLVLALSTFFDCPPCARRRAKEATRVEEASGEMADWSIPAIIGLTSYRFHTGFLAATWMPYLLAMEGRALMGERQSFFMGGLKLIYGCAILLNPLCGLLGDRLSSASHWSGRRIFVLLGVGCAGMGIYGCLVAAEAKNTSWYIASVTLWMLGEAMADVTTETLVPELLPPRQYGISGSLRGLNFLVGGLSGYGLLIFFNDVHYSWLYYAYLVVMVFCALLSLCLIGADDPRPACGRVSIARQSSAGCCELLDQAYLAPARLVGGFPMACFCVFIFSLGSCPMFFLYLMVRDMVGIRDLSRLQSHFGGISADFFICAAIASILLSVLAHLSKQQQASTPPQGSSGEAAAASREGRTVDEPENSATVVTRWRTMLLATLLYGLITALIPVSGVPTAAGDRLKCFYVLAGIFGLAFGCAYCKFQECTWSILPNSANVANCMGWAAMCRCGGVGLGNFIAGVVLEQYSLGLDAYAFRGYMLLCFGSASAVFLSAALVSRLAEQVIASSQKAVDLAG
eukprot:TRINITY_DN32733_c0_g1_i2.p1 TRINITY_DN32733_c0_g1~~TRINITY_DN32733_c0_g1_i2.p1  ORF type:complete len:628 (+),score=130.24 TRINITY_DN32733_c0_g1_i2:193-2076(+)